MKLILENWKKFINEVEIVDTDEDIYDQYQETEEQEEDEGSRLERQQFGYNKETITSLANDLINMTKQNTSWKWKEVVNQIQTKYDITLQMPDSGAFRTAYDIGNNLILKIAKDGWESYKMNGEDKTLGTDASIDGIFPRVYFWSEPIKQNQYSWIVMEKVTPLKTVEEVLKFFDSNLIKKENIKDLASQKAYIDLLAVCLNSTQQTGIISLSSKQHENFILYLLNADKPKDEPKETSIDYKKLAMDFKYMSPTFQKLVKLKKQYPDVEAIELIKPYNCGVGYDGRFVVLDSSIF